MLACPAPRKRNRWRTSGTAPWNLSVPKHCCNDCARRRLDVIVEGWHALHCCRLIDGVHLIEICISAQMCICLAPYGSAKMAGLSCSISSTQLVSYKTQQPLPAPGTLLAGGRRSAQQSPPSAPTAQGQSGPAERAHDLVN